MQPRQLCRTLAAALRRLLDDITAVDDSPPPADQTQHDYQFRHDASYRVLRVKDRE